MAWEIMYSYQSIKWSWTVTQRVVQIFSLVKFVYTIVKAQNDRVIKVGQVLTSVQPFYFSNVAITGFW